MGCNRHNNNDVANVFFPNRNKNQVRATVDFDDLCRAVRRCLINDLVAGARDDRDDRDCHNRRDRRRRGCCW